MKTKDDNNKQNSYIRYIWLWKKFPDVIAIKI